MNDHALSDFARATTTDLGIPGVPVGVWARWPGGVRQSSRDEVTRRFAVGHDRAPDGTLSIARLWRRSRATTPAAGSRPRRLPRLAGLGFHLGDGGAGRVPPAELLDRMKQPTVALRGRILDDAIGIGWRAASRSSRCPALVPDDRAVVRWAPRAYLGMTDQDPQPLPCDEARARDLVGSYQNEVMTLTIATDGVGLRLEVRLKPGPRAAHAPFELGLLPDGADGYVITSGAFSGERGLFTRDHSGAIVVVDLAGRLFERAPA